MEVTEDWLDLKVKRYKDGNYEAYEALSDSRFETKSWSAMRQWLRTLIDDTTAEVDALERKKEEVSNGRTGTERRT